MTELFVPALDADTDVITAAIAYAKGGWYVLPVRRGSKHPGSVVGDHWQHQSSREAEQIVAWFAGSDHGIALHVGRSGALVFDVDDPDRIPTILGEAIQRDQPPFQSTRGNVAHKGHYLYTAPPGRQLGNSTGKLGKGWGEVRGRNGVIIVEPSLHPKASEGGRYAWLATGTVPPLPDELAELLPDSAEATDAATDAEVRAFCDRHIEQKAPELAFAVLHSFQRELSEGGSRHDAMVTAACWAARESRAGAYSAKGVFHRLRSAFVESLAAPRSGSTRTATEAVARAEFLGIVAWAVAQAGAANLTEIRRGIEQRIPGYDVPPPAEPPDDDWPAPAAQPEDSPAGDQPDTESRVYNYEVQQEVHRLRVRDTARRMFRTEQAGTPEPPKPVLLSDLLDQPDTEAQYRIHGLLPVGGRVVVAAQFKAGKTTLTGNLSRVLADGGAFLGCHNADPVTGRVVIFDTEMSQDTLKSWLRDQNIKDADRLAIVSLRGKVGSFDLLDSTIHQEWVTELRALAAEVVILDCLRPVLDVLGLDENTDAGRLLVALDTLVDQSGAQELVVVHHMGHTGERSRGSSRIRDWPDVEWRLVRQDADDPTSQRFFSAYGRDVEVPESALEYDPATRHLTLAGGNRQDAEAARLVPDVLRIIADAEGLAARAIERALAEQMVPQKVGRAAVKVAINERLVRTAPGAKNATNHYLTGKGREVVNATAERVSAGDELAGEDQQRSDHGKKGNTRKKPGQKASASVRRSSSAFTRRGDSECVSASIDDALTRTDADPSSASEQDPELDAWVKTSVTRHPKPVGAITEDVSTCLGTTQLDPFRVQSSLERLAQRGEVTRHDPTTGPATWSLPTGTTAA